MARLVLLGGIVLTTAGAQYSCSSDGSGSFTDRNIDTGDGATFVTTLTLRDSAGTEADHFSRLDLITFELTVRNRTQSTVQLQIGQPQRDFMAFTAGANSPRWRFTEGMNITTEVIDLTFAPQETKTFTLTWNQEQRGGSFLPKGRYEARGLVTKIGYPTSPLASDELFSDFTPFTVD